MERKVQSWVGRTLMSSVMYVDMYWALDERRVCIIASSWSADM